MRIERSIKVYRIQHWNTLEPMDRFKVVQTTNILEPHIGDSITEKELQALISDDVTVTVVRTL